MMWVTLKVFMKGVRKDKCNQTKYFIPLKKKYKKK